MTTPAIVFETAGKFRAWLRAHHARESALLVCIRKAGSSRTGITYAEALDEALCYGWVDSLIKRLDDDRFARKFTPRKPDSRWSEVNRKRYAGLKALGRLKPPGIARAPGARGSAPKPKRVELPAKLPSYIEVALRKHPVARRNYNALSPAHQRRYFAWIASAKREETRMKRLDEAIRMLTRGVELGLK